MKRIPEASRLLQTGPEPMPAARSELDGLVELGMKRDALRLARSRLRDATLTAETFNEAVNAVLTLADNLKSWSRLVKSAYERLPRRQQPAARFMMMSVHNGCGDHEGVLQLLPKPSARTFTLEELAYGMEAVFALGNKEMMMKLAVRLPHAVKVAQHPIMQARLLLCLAEFFVRSHQWDQAMSIFEAVQTDETLCREAVAGIAEIHTVRALLALQKGLELNAQYHRNFDPETETMLPGNDQAVLEQAAKEFRRLQKIIERIVPEKRRKELALPERL